MSALWMTIVVAAVVPCSLAFPDYRDPLSSRLQDYLDDRQIIQAQPPPPRAVSNWPASTVKLGQVSGVATGPAGEVYVFHRGSRAWTDTSFFPNNSFTEPDATIPEKTLLTLDGRTGTQKAAIGDNMFLMPHGLSLDHHGNLWVTDVGLHQVMRIPRGQQQPDVVLGKAKEPGDAGDQFCKPTDVAVASNGDYFVSDGYCNSRIMKFNKDNKLVKTWGKTATIPLDKYSLNVPHSLALVESRDMICVADREDHRVPCFNAGLRDASKTGEHMLTLLPSDAAGTVYAIAYEPQADVMYAVFNPETTADHARGYTISMDGLGLEEWWIDQSHQSLPHDVAVSQDGNDIYVGDIKAGTAVKLQRPRVYGF